MQSIQGQGVHTFILPIYIDLPISENARSAKNKKRLAEGKPFDRYWLNKNQERNWHHHIYNNLKMEFAPLQMPEMFKADKIRISYRVEKQTKRKFDTRNISDIVDKFFCDWLVTCGYIEDDNCDIVSHGGDIGKYGCVENRCIATVEILETSVK